MRREREKKESEGKGKGALHIYRIFDFVEIIKCKKKDEE